MKFFNYLYESYKGKVRFGDSRTSIKGKGKIVSNFPYEGLISLTNAIYTLCMRANIITLGRLSV